MFLDRSDAGQQLATMVASRLVDLAVPLRDAGGLVLGLPALVGRALREVEAVQAEIRPTA